MSSCTEAPGSLLGLRYWGSAIGAPTFFGVSHAFDLGFSPSGAWPPGRRAPW